MIYSFLITLACGMFTAFNASVEGRSVLGWFLIGFSLGPIGLILFIVVSKNSKRVKERAVRLGEMRKCPFCEEIVKAEVKLCEYCKKDIIAVKESNNKIEIEESLHEAVWNGNWASSRRLLKNGFDVNQVNENGHTALELSLMRRDKLITELLLSYGAKDRKVE